jgi:pilus assembly protein CpaE
MWTAREEDGQATVELIALLPALAVVATLALQALLAGATLWLAGGAAREAARARALGADPAAAARAALPSPFRGGGVRVAGGGDDGVRVTVPIPSLVGGLRVGSVTIRARMEPQR